MAYEQGYVGDPRGREAAIEASQGGNGSSSPYSPYVPAPYSPYIKSEAQIKQDIIRARQKQLYGTPFTQMPKTLESLNKELNTTVNPTLNALINFLQGKIGGTKVNYQGGARRLNVNVPLLNMGGGLLSGQGSYSPYGNNYLGFKYTGNW